MKRSRDDINSTIISNAIYQNTYSPILPWVRSVGFRTHQTAYQESLSLSSCADSFFINSVHTRNDPQTVYSILNYLDDTGVTMISMHGEDHISTRNKIELPIGAPIALELGKAIAKRRSIRHFTGDAIGQDYLATLLRAGSGVSSKDHASLFNSAEVEFAFRTHSSAGALYPVDLYIAVINIRGLNPGIYQYHAKQDVLTLLADELSCKNLLNLTAQSENAISLTQANAIILFVMTPWRSMRKYGPRGLRFAFYESGTIAQNIHLACVALGLGSVDYASFYEDEVNQLLALDGILQSFTHAIVIGCPN